MLLINSDSLRSRKSLNRGKSKSSRVAEMGKMFLPKKCLHYLWRPKSSEQIAEGSNGPRGSTQFEGGSLQKIGILCLFVKRFYAGERNCH